MARGLARGEKLPVGARGAAASISARAPVRARSSRTRWLAPLRFPWPESRGGRHARVAGHDDAQILRLHPAAGGTGRDHTRDRAGTMGRMARQMAEGEVQQLASAR